MDNQFDYDDMERAIAASLNQISYDDEINAAILASLEEAGTSSPMASPMASRSVSPASSLSSPMNSPMASPMASPMNRHGDIIYSYQQMLVGDNVPTHVSLSSLPVEDSFYEPTPTKTDIRKKNELLTRLVNLSKTIAENYAEIKTILDSEVDDTELNDHQLILTQNFEFYMSQAEDIKKDIRMSRVNKEKVEEKQEKVEEKQEKVEEKQEKQEKVVVSFIYSDEVIVKILDLEEPIEKHIDDISKLKKERLVIDWGTNKPIQNCAPIDIFGANATKGEIKLRSRYSRMSSIV